VEIWQYIKPVLCQKDVVAATAISVAATKINPQILQQVKTIIKNRKTVMITSIVTLTKVIHPENPSAKRVHKPWFN
jgi:hypothetical protein